MSYTRQEQEANFTRLFGILRREAINQFTPVSDGDRRTHFSYAMYEDSNYPLQRDDYVDILPENPAFPGADRLRLILETEFVYSPPPVIDPVTGQVHRQPPIVVKGYSNSSVFGGVNSSVTNLHAFQDSLNRTEREIHSDPPTVYLAAAIAEREEEQRPATPGLEDDLGSILRRQLGEADALLVGLTALRENIIRTTPGVDARRDREAEAIRDRYSVEVLSVSLGNPQRPETIIQYSFQDARALAPARAAVVGLVSQEITDRWTNITEIFNSGQDIPEVNYIDEYAEVDYRAPEDGDGGTSTGELVRWPQEAEIERLIHYYNESQADLDGGQTARQISPEFAAYGISLITIRRSPINEAWDHVESINVRYEEPNRYTGLGQTSKTFIPESRIRIPSRATSQNHRNDVVLARLEEELIDIDVLIIELDEIAGSDDPLESGIVKKVREISLKLDDIERRANREPDGEARGSILAQVGEKRELVEPHKILAERLQSELQGLFAESDKEIRELLNKEESILATKRFIIVDSKQRSLEFKLPIKKNDKSIQVLVIKKFLGLPFSSGDIFDEDTKERLKTWQQDNSEDILGLEPTDGEYTTDFHSPHFAISPLWVGQYGRVDTLSYIIMKRQGLASAVTEVLDELGDIRGSIRGTGADSLAILGERDPGDAKSAPWEDTEYYYYTWFSNATRRDVNSTLEGSYENFIRKQSETALREGTKKIFDHHGQYTSWVVRGDKDSHSVYASVLHYQNRIETMSIPKDKRYVLTIEQQSLAENVDLRPPNDAEDPSIDVLFGQDLKENALTIFSSIHKVHSPTRRPNSKFKFTIRVRKEMLDQVGYPPGPTQAITLGALIGEIRDKANLVVDAVSNFPDMAHEIGMDAHERANDATDAVHAAGQAVTEGIDWVSENKTEAVKKGVGAAFGMAKKYARDAEIEGLKQLSGFGDRVSKKQEKAFQAALTAMDVRRESLPATVIYKVKDIEKQIDKIREMFFKYNLDLYTWRIKGGRMRPQIDFKKEYEKLKEVETALKTILRANGRSNPKNGDELAISFEEVKMKRKVSKKPLKMVEDRAGVVPFLITYKKTGKLEVHEPLMRATKDMHKAHPWNDPRTMNYLMNLDDLYKAAVEDARICLEDFGELLGAPRENMFEVIQQFTTPYVIILKANARSQINLPSEAKFFGPIKRWEDKLNEDWNLDSKNPKSTLFRNGVIRFERGKTYSIIDPIPKEDLCTLEELYQEFLDKFDFAALFCSYASCIPDIPWPIKFDWDFDWSLPTLPKMPRWDPLKILIPMIEAALLDMLVAFLCGLVRGILDLIKFPSCADLLDYGASLWESAWGKEKDTDKKLLVMKDAANALDEMDLPVESYADLADLFDALAEALTPPEMCSLLEGEASLETLIIVKELMEKHYSGLSEHLNNESLIAEFFGLLGRFIDPELCAKLSNSANVVVGELCPDIESPTLREQLLSQNATPEEISRAITDSEKRRAALKELMQSNPMESLMEKMNLPGPYDTNSSNKMANLATESSLSSIAPILKNDLISFVPSLYEVGKSQKKSGDPGFNKIDSANYEFVSEKLKETIPKRRRLQAISRQFQEIEGGVGGFEGFLVSFMRVTHQAGQRYDTMGITGQEDLYNGDGTLNHDSGEGWSWSEIQKIDRQGRVFVDERGNTQSADDVDKMGFTIVHYDHDDEFRIYWNGTNINGRGNGYPNTPRGRGNAQDKMKEILTGETVNIFKIPKPGSPSTNDNGDISVTQAVKMSNVNGRNVEEKIYFNMTVPSDQNELHHILMFRLRNMKDDVFVVPELRRYLTDTTTAEMKSTRQIELDLPFDINITYIDSQFDAESIKDAFSLKRPTRTYYATAAATEEESAAAQDIFTVTKNYCNELPDEIINMRLSARDIIATPAAADPSQKYLRAGAFAEIFMSSWSESLQRYYPNAAQKVGGYDNDLWKKVNGLRDQNESYSAYKSVSNLFLDKIGKSVLNSRFFDTQEISDLADTISAEFIPKHKEDGTVECYVRNRNVIDFKKMKAEIMDSYKESLGTPENDPLERDFAESGPLENSIISQLVLLYAKTYILEFMLKGLFVFSRFGPGQLSNSVVIQDYLKDYLVTSLEGDLQMDRFATDSIKSEVLKLANDTDLESAVSTIIQSVLNNDEIVETANKIFKPKYGSFKEEVFNEWSSNIREVNSLENISPSKYENKGFRKGMVPLHSSFGGVYEKAEDLLHPNFFVEKYYRFSDDMVSTYFPLRQRRGRHRSVVRRQIDIQGTEGFEIDIDAYRGVFNQYELNELIGLFSQFTMDLEGPALAFARAESPDEMEFVDRLNTLGSLKVGLRLVFVPTASSDHLPAPHAIAAQSRADMISEGDILPDEVEPDEFWRSRPVEGYQIDPESIPRATMTMAEIQADIAANLIQGRPPSPEAAASLAALEEGMRQHGLIENLATLNMRYGNLTSRTRSYIADTNPKFGHIRGPRDTSTVIDTGGGDDIEEGRMNTTDLWKTDPAFALGTSHIVKREEFIESVRERIAVRNAAGAVLAWRPGALEQNLLSASEEVWTPGKPQNIMFPTPIVEVELDYCPKDLMSSVARDSLGSLSRYDELIESTNDALVAAMFGLGRKSDTGVRNIEASYDAKVEYLFDFIFPLDRYQELFLIFSQGIMDPIEDIATFMDPTRGVIKRQIYAMKNIQNIATLPSGGNFTSLLSDQTSFGFGNIADKLAGDMAVMVKRMIKNFIPGLIRHGAAHLDPAYKDMKKIWDKNPELVSKGLTMGSISSDLLFEPGGDPLDPKTLDKGFLDGEYMPFNFHGPVDLTLAFGQLAFAATTVDPPLAAAAAAQIANIYEHIENAITDNKDNRYGKFITPVGLLGLSMPELSGEKDRVRKKDPLGEIQICEEEQGDILTNEEKNESEDAAAYAAKVEGLTGGD
jgi:hypothetical protein